MSYSVSSDIAPREPHRDWRWPSWAGGAVVALCLLASSSLLVLMGEKLCVGWQPPRMLAQAPGLEAPDGGVGEEALASVHAAPQTALPVLFSFGRPMPRHALEGQRKPPCERGEVAINGGCWVGPIGDERPPCGDTMFDWEGHCYKASVDMPRQPTSEGPP